jgi:hypothetical protein
MLRSFAVGIVPACSTCYLSRSKAHYKNRRTSELLLSQAFTTFNVYHIEDGHFECKEFAGNKNIA